MYERQLVTDESNSPPLERALALLGPLASRVMRLVWSGSVKQPFVVRDIQLLMPESAYTTVMTILNRLVDRNALLIEQIPGQRAHGYRASGGPETFLAESGRGQAQRMIEQFGDGALVAFVEQYELLTPEQRERLRRMGRR